MFEGVWRSSEVFKVFGGVRRCLEVFEGVRGSSEVFEGVRRSSKVFEGVRRSSEVFKVFGAVWRCSGEFGGVRRCSEKFRGVRGSSEVFGEVRGSSEDFRAVWRDKLTHEAETNKFMSRCLKRVLNMLKRMLFGKHSVFNLIPHLCLLLSAPTQTQRTLFRTEHFSDVLSVLDGFILHLHSDDVCLYGARSGGCVWILSMIRSNSVFRTFLTE